MFAFRHCVAPGCYTYCLDEQDTCFEHTKDAQDIVDKILLEAKPGSTFDSHSLNFATVSNHDFSDMKLVGSNLFNMHFKNCTFDRSHMRFCFFQFSSFENCTFVDSVIHYSLFAGSSFIDCDFSGSDILHTNFEGIHAEDSNFSMSDLYYSTFVSAYLNRVAFKDCNLKKTDFYDSTRREVSFKYSNFQEARFEQRGKA